MLKVTPTREFVLFDDEDQFVGLFRTGEEFLSGVPDAIFGENRLPKNVTLLTCYRILSV